MDLGDIEAPAGLRIAGTVRDVAGDPVDGARVTIGRERLHADPLCDAADGNFETVRRSDGTFLFEGVYVRDSDVRLSASHPTRGASLELPVSGAVEELSRSELAAARGEVSVRALPVLAVVRNGADGIVPVAWAYPTTKSWSV